MSAARPPEGARTAGPPLRMAATVLSAVPQVDARWAGVRSLLAVRLDNLGDVVMTTPALNAVRRSLPGARITLLCSAAALAAQPHLPMVDAVLPCAAPWMKGGGDAVAPDQALLRRLAAGGFDAAIVFTVCTQSALPAALMCRLAGIPLRLAHSRENPYGLLSDWVADTDRVRLGMRHEVRRQLDLVRSVGMVPADEHLEFFYRAADLREMREALARAGCPPGQPYAVLHVGASAPSRRYPAERFAAAADAFACASGCHIVLTGSSEEGALVDSTRARMACAASSVAGQLTLGALGALLAGARVLIANNTGPVHMAAAVGTPVVVLYALTNPQHTPWMTPSRVLFHDVSCRNCLQSVCPQPQHACLALVDPADVAAAALELIDPAPALRPGRPAPPALATIPWLAGAHA
jgi:lipopolysaccharide heptosyltransferase II